MAYDESIANRVRDLLAGEPDLAERRMFGGLGFILGGRMAMAASSRGGLLVRVDRHEAERLLDQAGVELMDMGGRVMKGWLHIGPEALETKRQLARWVQRGLASARSASD